MGVPTSEVGYMPRREDHEVHKDMGGGGIGGKKQLGKKGINLVTLTVKNNDRF